MDPSIAPPLVLVAEDDDDMRGLVARHLSEIGDLKLDIIQAEDGEEAWRLAKERLPDLVVLDVMMPGMSGWEVCKKIREDVSLAHTGVVMLTGIGENLNQMTSPLYGADAFIDKPFEFEELALKVKEALEARAAQRDAVPRPVNNGVSRPASAELLDEGDRAKPAKKKAAKKAAPKKKAAAAKKAAAKKTKTKQKSTTAKGKVTKMAAKKTAKKAAPKKTAKKAAKKAAKKGAKKKAG